MRSIIVVSFFTVLFCLVLATERSRGADAAAQTANNQAVASERQRVKLIADQKQGVLRVAIDGKPVAWFDTSGLHVPQSIEYGGTIGDTGTDYLTRQAGGASAP